MAPRYLHVSSRVQYYWQHYAAMQQYIALQ